jgi:hypothetical protein
VHRALQGTVLDLLDLLDHMGEGAVGEATGMQQIGLRLGPDVRVSSARRSGLALTRVSMKALHPLPWPPYATAGRDGGMPLSSGLAGT